MTKRIHVNSRIYFPRPYVVRLSYLDGAIDQSEADWRALMRRTYRVMTGTWGHTALEFESYQPENHHNNSGSINSLASLFVSDFVSELRGYVCFENELDALQFRLTLDTRSIKVNMWPDSRKFTIHEVIEHKSLN